MPFDALEAIVPPIIPIEPFDMLDLLDRRRSLVALDALDPRWPAVAGTFDALHRLRPLRAAIIIVVLSGLLGMGSHPAQETVVLGGSSRWDHRTGRQQGNQNFTHHQTPQSNATS
jgi:hypothetical protein